MAVVTPLTKVSAGPMLPVFAAMILLPSLSVFLGAGENAPVHHPKRLKIVTFCCYGEGTDCSPMNNSAVTTLVQEQAELSSAAVAQDVQYQLNPAPQLPNGRLYNDDYSGLSSTGGDEIVSNLLPNLLALAWKYRIRMLFISANIFGCTLLACEIAGARARRRK